MQRLFAWALLLGEIMSPLTVSAHLVSTGFGPVYDGIGHFIYSLEELLPLVLLALLAGLNGKAAARSAVFIVPLAWFAGGIAGLLLGDRLAMPSSDWPLAMAILVLGVAVAIDRALPLPVLRFVLALVGAGAGFMSGAGLSRLPDAHLILAGSLLAQCVALTWISAAVVFASQHAGGLRIAVRVVGSWIAATGMLLIGWQFRS